MELDIQSIIDSTRELLTNSYSEHWPVIKDIATAYLEATEKRLTDLKDNLLSGEITPDFALERLKEEPAILKSELTSFAVLIGAAGEEITNAVLNTFKGIIDTVTLKKDNSSL